MFTKKIEEQKQSDYIKCFGLLLIMLLPVVGVIATVIFLTSSKKNDFINTLSRAVFLVHICFTVIFISLFIAAGAFINSLKKQYPQIENGYAYATAFLKNGVDGVINEMSENGELDKILAKINIEKLLQNVDISKLLSSLDTKDLLEIIDTEAIIEHFSINDVVTSLDGKKLISMIEPDKLMQYIDIKALLLKINEKELLELLDNKKDK